MSIADDLRAKYATDLPPRKQQIGAVEKAREQWRGRMADLIAEVARREAIQPHILAQAADAERADVEAKCEDLMRGLVSEIELAHKSIEALEQEIIGLRAPKE